MAQGAHEVANFEAAIAEWVLYYIKDIDLADQQSYLDLAKKPFKLLVEELSA